MTFLKSVWFALLLYAVAWLDKSAAFSRNPNLSPYTYYKVTFTNANAEYLNGFYVKNKALGIYKTSNCGDLNCTSGTSCYWNGTWIYEYKYSSSTSYYLFEIYTNQQYQAAIALSPCEASNWLVSSRPVKKTTGLGTSQNFTLAAKVAWKTQSSSSYNIVIGQTAICFSGQSGCNSPNPTRSPTKHPVIPPTRYPTIPTRFPTLPTRGPTKAPTTPKPTTLPTTPTVFYSSTSCSTLKVTGLSAIFTEKQADYRFKLLATSTYKSDGRRMWSNGRGVQVYYSKRWYPQVGVWVVSNGTISLVQNRTQRTNDAPGANTATYGLWDHFLNDNVYEPIQSRITLGMKCLTVTTSWPTPLPTQLPTNLAITPTSYPTRSPTPSCVGLFLNLQASTCPQDVSGGLIGFFDKQTAKVNGKVHFAGTTNKGTNVFWSDLFDSWVLDGADGFGYSALSPSDPYSHFLPQSANWTVFDKTDTFSLDCEMTIKYFCFATGFPTAQPTPQPISKAPTAHTSSPTKRPTKKPTKYPSYSPSRAPSRSPTSSPVDRCYGISVTGTNDELSQRYQINYNDTISNHKYWNAVNGDGEIFFSSSVLHESWVINSESLGIYWLARNTPKTQPPLKSVWDLYISTSPFLVKSANLTLTCNKYWFPTPYPTSSPSAAPTRNPTRHPTKNPTKPPTNHPTAFPTGNPTRSPSRYPTRNPTRHPTTYPTGAPTSSPTDRICTYMILSGVPLYSGTYKLLRRDINNNGQWEKVDDKKKNLTNTNGTWILQDSSKSNISSYMVESTDWKPPDESKWYLGNIGSSSEVTIKIKCDGTQSPTFSPTRHPTMAPTRSHCNSIEVKNETEVIKKANIEMKIIGWYRKQKYLINGKWWWLSEDGDEAIKYLDGLWYILRIDNPKIDTETTPHRILTNTSRFDDRPPFEAKWLYPKYPELSVQLKSICHGTMKPSKAPTRVPTQVPTPNNPPQWTFCPKKPFFTFTTNGTNLSVFWQIPKVKDEKNENVTITLWQQIYGGINLKSELKQVNMKTVKPGIYLAPAHRYDMIYVAKDSKGLTRNCTVMIYVINATLFNSYDLCVKKSFSIDVTINEDNYLIQEEQSIKYDVDNGLTIGKVNLPQLNTKRQNCYVRAHFVGKVSPKAAETQTSNYLGIKGQTIVWQIIVLIFVVCVFGLAAEAIRRCVKEYRDAHPKEEQDNLIRAVDATTEEKEAIMAGVAPAKLLRKATLQNLNAPGSTAATNSRRQKSEGVESSDASNAVGKAPSAIELQSTHANDEKVSEPISAPKSPGKPPPSLQGYIPPPLPPSEPPPLAKVPQDEAFWTEALDELDSKGFKNRKKNLELLIRYALRNSDGSIDKMASANKVTDQLRKLLAKKKQQEQANAPGASKPKDPGANGDGTKGNDAVLNMLQRDWEDAGLDKREGDPEPPPPALPDGMKPPNPVPPPVGGPAPAYPRDSADEFQD